LHTQARALFFVNKVQIICRSPFFLLSLHANMRILLSILIVGLAVIGLCVRIILKKNGRFSSQHIGGNKAMRERGIHCVNTQDYEMRHQQKINIKKL